jgi:ribosomal protein S25
VTVDKRLLELDAQLAENRRNGPAPLAKPTLVGHAATAAAKESLLLRLRDINAALEETPMRAEWLWHGYVPRRGVAALAGRPKVGKSYLLFGILAALRRGEQFLGRAVAPTRAVLLTEERHATLREKRDHFGLGAGVDVLMRHEAAGVPWRELVTEVGAYCREHEVGLLAVDTWDKWTGLSGEQENVAGAVNEAMAPLLDVAVERGVLVSIHQRKAGGKHGEAVRGSNALAGAVDVLIELERLKGADEDARVLYAVSRYIDTPAELGLHFTEDGYERGETSTIRTASTRRRVREVVDTSGDGRRIGSADEIAQKADVSVDTARRRLKELEEEKVVVSDSSKSPTVWLRSSSDPFAAAPAARHETEGRGAGEE